MPRRHIGIIELEWVCPVCRNRNPGPEKVCKSCGAAQPENVQFEAPLEQKVITDEAVKARAQIGADRHCPFCDARNPANAKICSQCGADLGEATARATGAVLEALQDRPAPPVSCAACGSQNPATATICANCGARLHKPKPIASLPERQSRGSAFGFLFVLFGIVLLGVVVLVVLSVRTTSVGGQVQAAEWVRSIEVEALVPVQESAWWDQIPPSAQIDSCQSEMRGTSDTPTNSSKEVCGTPFTVDTGTGYGEVNQDCWYEVYEDVCTYTIERWRTIDTITTSGAGFEPLWPALSLNLNQRAGERGEQLQCIINANDQTYVYQPSSFAEYTLCQPGASLQLEVNSFGSIRSVQLTE